MGNNNLTITLKQLKIWQLKLLLLPPFQYIVVYLHVSRIRQGGTNSNLVIPD